MRDGIVFQVETIRDLQILAREIYDSRFSRSGALADGDRIEIRVDGGAISITDNGVGMNEDTLRENFWKTALSGKHSGHVGKRE